MWLIVAVANSRLGGADFSVSIGSALYEDGAMVAIGRPVIF